MAGPRLIEVRPLAPKEKAPPPDSEWRIVDCYAPPVTGRKEGAKKGLLDSLAAFLGFGGKRF